MVVMSVEQFEHINGSVEAALDAADRQAATTSLRYTHDEVIPLHKGRAPQWARGRSTIN